MSPRPIAYEYREGNALSPKWGIRVKPAGSIAPGPRFSPPWGREPGSGASRLETRTEECHAWASLWR